VKLEVIPSSGITLSPETFCPATHGSVRIAAAALSGETAYRARVFDMEGREVAMLASGPVAAPAVSVEWDGRRDGAGLVETGLYICVVDFSEGGGGVCRIEKRTLVVWAGQ
jgi:hypothetical protein